jgi:hypothetical protein
MKAKISNPLRSNKMLFLKYSVVVVEMNIIVVWTIFIYVAYNLIENYKSKALFREIEKEMSDTALLMFDSSDEQRKLLSMNLMNGMQFDKGCSKNIPVEFNNLPNNNTGSIPVLANSKDSKTHLGGNFAPNRLGVDIKYNARTSMDEVSPFDSLFENNEINGGGDKEYSSHWPELSTKLAKHFTMASLGNDNDNHEYHHKQPYVASPSRSDYRVDSWYVKSGERNETDKTQGVHSISAPIPNSTF